MAFLSPEDSFVHTCHFLSREDHIFLPFLAQKICKERNCLVHLLSPDSKVSNVLDLSQKVVVRAQNFTQTPEMQLCL